MSTLNKQIELATEAIEEKKLKLGFFKEVEAKEEDEDRKQKITLNIGTLKQNIESDEAYLEYLNRQK